MKKQDLSKPSWAEFAVDLLLLVVFGAGVALAVASVIDLINVVLPATL